MHVHVDKYAWILCDNSDSLPGYTLLWLPLRFDGPHIWSACEQVRGRDYIYRVRNIERPQALYQELVL